MTKLHVINRCALPLHADFLIAGAHCSLATNSPAVLSAMSRWRCADRAPSGRTFEMDVLLDSSLPCNRDLKTQTHFRGLQYLVFATIGSHEVFTFDLLRKRVVGAVSLASADDPSFWNSHWIPITIGVMGTTVGVTPLHSACLDHHGRGLLIAGPSGAGKSTLSVALTKCGFSLISDDWTYIAKEKNELLAHGLSAPVKLLPDAAQHFPELKLQNPQMWFNGELAFEIDPAMICHASRKSASHPRWLMFLERTSKPGCDFTPCASSEAADFFECNAERLPDELPEASATRFAMIQAVTDRQCWRVRSGESPQVTAQFISRFCERN